MNTQQYNFKVKRGDTFSGSIFEMVVNSVPLDLTDTVIKAEFVAPNSNVASLLMSTENNKITIIDAQSGEFQFSEQIISLAPGIYNYDVQFTFPDGKVKTYITGVMTVEADITR